MSSGEQPPIKKPRQDPQGFMEAVFFKTKLCHKFMTGTCPYAAKCTFAHGIGELQKPPPLVVQENCWKARGERPVPTSVGSGNQVRLCRRYNSGERCAYGGNCVFLHDEQSRDRERVVISLLPAGGADEKDCGQEKSPVAIGGGWCRGVEIGQNLKPWYWKTRMCRRWEMDRSCLFGHECHFAHGTAELHRVRLADDSSDPHAMRVCLPKLVTDPVRVHAQRSVGVNLNQEDQRRALKWNGPDKISRIYGDWIN